MPSPRAAAAPLPTLLSQALIAFTIEFDNLAEERITAAGTRPWMVSQAMWANHRRLGQALDAILAAPCFAAGLAPRPGGWRTRPPYLAQTERVLADPRANLPHHPLVLHRGGFPDGA